MALPFFNGASRKRDQMVAIDLGGRTTKAVHLLRKGDRFILSRYALLEAPAFDKAVSAKELGEHFRAVCDALETKVRSVTLALGVTDSVVRHADLPCMPASDMRQVLKNNSKNYLQQDLPGHVFDCFIIPPRGGLQKAVEKSKTMATTAKHRVLVASAKKQLVDDMQAAVRASGMVADCIVPGLLGPVNAFEMAMPEVFAKEVVALVDIGFRSASICILEEGDLALSRVLGTGGDKLTTGLAETLGISYAEAEGIKIGMPSEVQSQLETFVLPLGRELRASIDFFEHQQDKTVAKVFVSGGTSKNEVIMQMLHAELMVECQQWNPMSYVEAALPPQQLAEIENIAPQLTVALGAATASF